MATGPRPTTRPRRPVAGPGDDLPSLVRRLATVLEAEPASDAGERVVFEFEAGGARYALVCRPAVGADDVVLSPREQEIGRLVAKGYVNKTIAGILDISGYTVDTYIRRLFAKLGVTTRAAMVAKLIESGLLPAAQLLWAEPAAGPRRA